MIEAVQWTGRNLGDMHVFMRAQILIWNPLLGNGDALFIRTLEGEMRADAGDWVIRGVKGEYYPCKPDIFEALYESADAGPAVAGKLSEGKADHVRQVFVESEDHG